MITPFSLTVAILVLEEVNCSLFALSVCPSYTLNPWLTDTFKVCVPPCGIVTILSDTCSLAIPILVYSLAVWNSSLPT